MPAVDANAPIMPTVAASPTPSVHIDLQIHISPDASPDQIDSILPVWLNIFTVDLNGQDYFLKVKRLQEDIDASSGVLPRKDVEKQLPVDAFDQLVTDKALRKR